MVKPKPVESDPLDTEMGYVLAGARLSSVAAEDREKAVKVNIRADANVRAGNIVQRRR